MVVPALDETAGAPEPEEPPVLSVKAPGNAAEALSFVIRDMPNIGKTGTMGTGQNSYKFRKLEDMTPVVAELFAKYGLVVTPRVLSWEQEEVGRTTNSNVIMEARVVMEYTFHHGASNTSIVAGSLGIGRDSSDKAGNKAQSAAFKYILLPSLMITDGKDDQDAERIEVARGGTRSTPPPPPAEPDAEPVDETLESTRKDALAMIRKLRDEAGLESPYYEAVRGEAVRVCGPAPGGGDAGRRVPTWAHDHPQDALEFVTTQYELFKGGDAVPSDAA